MNRRQKIIVSVTGIFLVLLILVGLTYAFFLTRIRGNNNPTSISVTTANLELLYQDADNGDIIGKDMILEPDSNNPIGEKTFTVTNNGNATIDNYGVVIENLAVKYANTTDEVTAGEVTSLVNGEDGNPDMKLEITCESSVEGKTCNGMNGYLPEKSGILLTNSIEEDEVHTYTATLTYLEDGTNQSDDMNKTIEGRFNIIDANNTVDIEGTVTGYTKGDFVQINSEEKESVIYPDGTYKFVGVKPDNHKITVRYRENGEEKLRGTAPTENISVVKGDSAGVEGNVITITDLSRTVKIDVNATTNAPTINTNIKEYSPFNEGTLAYEIYNNAKNATGDATVLSGPITLPITSISGENERVLSSIGDNDGTSYFFRGNVIDNYVTFSNMCWRIVRIEGDGSIKLTLAGEAIDNKCESLSTTGGLIKENGSEKKVIYGYKTLNGKYYADYKYNESGTITGSVSDSSITEGLYESLTSWYSTNFNVTSITSNIKQNTLWCLGGKELDDDNFYSSGNRYNTKTPSIVCGEDEEKIYAPIGTLTMDEVILAGGNSTSNKLYYLNSEAQSWYWTLTKISQDTNNPSGVLKDTVVAIFDDGSMYEGNEISFIYSVRPAVSLKPGITISDGVGTIDDPYIIN